MSTSNPRKRKAVVSKKKEQLWPRNVPLSCMKLPARRQETLYRKKMEPIKGAIVGERKVAIEEFRHFGFIECFERLGWEAGLVYNYKDNEHIYKEEIIDWMATLVRELGPDPPRSTTLTGTVHGVKVALSMDVLSRIAPFDSGIRKPNGEYIYPANEYILCTGHGMDKGEEWVKMIKELFVVPDGDYANYSSLSRSDLKPLPHLISKFMVWSIMPRIGDLGRIRKYEIRVLYALVTGELHLSLRQLIMSNIWESRERSKRTVVPHCHLLTQLLKDANAIPANSRYVAVGAILFERKFVNDTFTFKETTSRYVLQEIHSEFIYEVLKSPEEMQEEELMLDHNVRNVRQRNTNRPLQYNQWTSFERMMWDRQEQIREERMEIDRAHIFHRELYRQQLYEYTELVRHYMNHQQNIPYQSVVEHRDYSQLPFEYQMTTPPYPGLLAPRWWPQRPLHSSMDVDASTSAPPTAPDPFENSQVATSLWESVFNPSRR